MLSFKISANRCVDRIVTLQSPVRGRMLRVISICAIAMIAFAFCNVHAEITPLSQQMARSVMQNWPDGHYSTDQGEWKWDYRLGTVLNGMDAVWHNTADPRLLRLHQDCGQTNLLPTTDPSGHTTRRITVSTAFCSASSYSCSTE